ncbi:MAG TPA: hypothetical protein PLY73_09380, partial [Candidatus Ozemobacteraceae bacterium]|nr:hypothetical protein [Candidatus Ozemobacteraceae bacterium]
WFVHYFLGVLSERRELTHASASVFALKVCVPQRLCFYLDMGESFQSILPIPEYQGQSSLQA